MSGKRVTLDTETLLSQSEALGTLKNEYESMFSSMSNILTEMNEGWSANLSNNFTGKIQIAQKGFSKIVEVLECGAQSAKEVAMGFGDMNTILGRNASDLEGVVGAGIIQSIMTGEMSVEALAQIWPEMAEKFDNMLVLLPDNASLTEFVDILGKAEEGLFGTEYIGDARQVLDTMGDLFDGTVSSETIGKVADLLGGYDQILGDMGFSDGFASEIIRNGISKIWGDGQTIESISPSMVDYCDDMEQVVQIWKDGNYAEAIIQGYFRTIEGGVKITGEAIGDVAKNTFEAVNGVVDYYSEQNPIVKTILQTTGIGKVLEAGDTIINDIPWKDINESLIDSTGINFQNFIPELGKEMSNTWGNMVDDAVKGVPIVLDYVGEQFQNMGSGVVNAFDGLRSLLK